jgi:hypothetical protein
MSAFGFARREKEILRIIEILNPYRDNFVVVGGYAVDAYSPLPRYSVDCDVVIPKKELSNFTKVFSGEGFTGTPENQNELEGLETRRFKKTVEGNPVYIDLLVDGVRCRQTEAVWKFDEIKSASSERRVIGVASSVSSRVGSSELLVAMKLHSGRDADVKDVAMLIDDLSWQKVGAYAIRGNIEKVKRQLKTAIEKMQEKDFEPQLKSFFGSGRNEARRISEVIVGVKGLNEMIEKGRR